MFVGLVVKDGAGHTSDRVCKEDPKTNRHSHHHEKEEGIDQVIHDKATQGREGKLEHVLVDHETVANRTEVGPFIVIDLDCFNRNFQDGKGLASCEEHIHFVLIPLSLDI